jgi:hypothetical protein
MRRNVGLPAVTVGLGGMVLRRGHRIFIASVRAATRHHLGKVMPGSAVASWISVKPQVKSMNMELNWSTEQYDLRKNARPICAWPSGGKHLTVTDRISSLASGAPEDLESRTKLVEGEEPACSDAVRGT